jgi:exonuclease SbcC
MKIISCIAENFASYEHLKFDFTGKGLTLVSGPTGSGKSTLCDLLPWALFGRTSKGGAADGVLSWPGKKVTRVRLTLSLGMRNNVIISRHRGPKSKDNDLLFSIEDSDPQRGKDLIDTQRLINELLGMDLDMYLAGSYSNEFSQVSQFFITSAKNRRVICEQLVDLQLATNLQEKLKAKYRETEADFKAIKHRYDVVTAQIPAAQLRIERENKRIADWEVTQTQLIDQAQLEHDKFEVTRFNYGARLRSDIAVAQNIINQCSDKLVPLQAQYNSFKIHICDKCKTDLNYEEKHGIDNDLHTLKSKIDYQELNIKGLTERLKEKQLEKNPHRYTPQVLFSNVTQLQNELDDLLISEGDTYGQLVLLKEELTDTETLQRLLEIFRSQLIANNITHLESRCNDLLTRFFDAEIRVAFSAGSADKLEVEITKDGNICEYSQLSKGSVSY